MSAQTDELDNVIASLTNINAALKAQEISADAAEQEVPAEPVAPVEPPVPTEPEVPEVPVTPEVPTPEV